MDTSMDDSIIPVVSIPFDEEYIRLEMIDLDEEGINAPSSDSISTDDEDGCLISSDDEKIYKL